jgi:hypothetical protein
MQSPRARSLAEIASGQLGILRNRFRQDCRPRAGPLSELSAELARDNVERFSLESGGFCEVAQHDSGGEVSRPCVRDLIETGLS